MAGTYANLVLRNIRPRDVARYLRRAGRRAALSRSVHGNRVLFEESSEYDFCVGERIAGELSKASDAFALYVGLYDDDVLVYWLYQHGTCLDAYDSCPGYFDRPPFVAITDADSDTIDAPERRGGDATVLSAAFRRTEAIPEVDRVLRTDYVFETERHEDLARLLGLPTWVVCNGYRNVAGGELCNGLDRSVLLHGRRTADG